MTGLVLLCGRSFSGKSTLAERLAADLPGEVVGLDALNAERGLWGGDGIGIEEWAKTMDLAHQRATEAVGRGATVIIDDTSSPTFLRDGWRRRAADLGVPLVLVHLAADETTVRSRHVANRSDPRRRDVADAVLAEHLASFEPPTPAEAPVTVPPGTDPATVVAAVRGALAAARVTSVPRRPRGRRPRGRRAVASGRSGRWRSGRGGRVGGGA